MIYLSYLKKVNLILPGIRLKSCLSVRLRHNNNPSWLFQKATYSNNHIQGGLCDVAIFSLNGQKVTNFKTCNLSPFLHFMHAI